MIGYGSMPADTIKTLKPKSTVTNLLAIKLQVTKDAIILLRENDRNTPCAIVILHHNNQ